MPYRYVCLLFCLFFFFPNAHAQYENVWAFGRMGAGLDFNTGMPLPVPTNLGVYPGTTYEAFGESSASVCDANGQLLFYTEGFYVWDKNGNVMPNGRELVPAPQGAAMNGFSPTSSTAQGAVIVPLPGDPDKYYIFSLTAKEQWLQSAGQLYYSLVDMSLNGGLGDVVPTTKGIFVDSFLAEMMTATLGNACNIWLLVCGIDVTGGSNFKAFEITAAGLNTTPVISNVGLANIYTPIGSFAVSSNGKKMIATQTGAWGGLRGAALFDFDVNRGVISNPLQLLPYDGGYGASFSPDNSKVYVTTDISELYQFDLSSNDPNTIIASQTLVGRIAWPIAHLKLGPDRKIYFQYDNQHLGRIDQPDNAGISCGFVPQAVQMLPGQQLHAGLPSEVVTVPIDTFLTAQQIEAPCWANVHPAVLQARQTWDSWDYVWQDGITGDSRTADTPGTYWIHYYSPRCNVHTDTFHVSFPNGVLPQIHIQNSCNGADNGKAWVSTYAGDTVSYTYRWATATGGTLAVSDTLSDVSSGHYMLYVQTATCDTVLSFFIPDEVHRVAFQADSIICQGTPLQFSNTSDSVFRQFEWDFGDQASSAQGDPEYVFNQTGTYRVKLTGRGIVCKDSVVKTVLVDSMFTGKFITVTDSICTGEYIEFFPQTDNSALSLYWNFGDNAERTASYEQRIQHAYDAAGEMAVQLDMRFRACPDAHYTHSITVFPFPEVDLGQDSSICLHGQPVFLENLRAAPLSPYHQVWSTGDTTALLKVVHPGTYTLSVTAEPIGCTTTERVEIRKDCYVDIPNAFTPNGDGHNDYFFPKQVLSERVNRFRMQIFNRWGQLVFETSATDGRGWDGRFNDNIQPTGVYLYRIETGFTDGGQETYQGNVTLLW